MPLKPKAIFFDAAGTLINVKDSVGHIYAKVGQRHGFDLDPNEINRRFKALFPTAPPLCFPDASPTKIPHLEKRWWYDLVRLVLDDIKNHDRFSYFFDDLYKSFMNIEAWEIYPDVLECLNRFYKNSIPMGIISNFDSRLHQILKNLRLNTYFRWVFCSSEMGLAKPNLEFFTKILQKCHLQPSPEIIYMGDNFELDIEPTKKLGLTAIYLNRKSNSSAHTNSINVINIHSMAELNKYRFEFGA